MTLIERIEGDLRDSMRARDVKRLGALRMLKTGIKNAAIEARVEVSALAFEQIVPVIRREAAKRKEAIEAFTAGGRSDLAETERAELRVLEAYLPAGLDGDSIKKIISDVILEKNLEQPYQFGTLMGYVVKAVAGRADGMTIKSAVLEFIKTG